MATPNWSMLVEQNRAKGIGIPWSEPELKALYEYKIPAQFVREGCLTPEDFEALSEKTNQVEKETGEKSIFRMTKQEMKDKAVKMGVVFTDEITRPELMQLLNRKPIA